MVTPSRKRSTTSVASAVPTDTGSRRLYEYARATSPTRAGRRLLAMKPTHTAAKRERNGLSGCAGARKYRQRMARTGNVAVVTATARSRSPKFALLT